MTPRRARRSIRLSRPARLLGVLGIGLVTVVVGAAVFAPLVARFSPTARTGRPFEHPSATHLLGTNDIGQDLFAQLLYGARVSLIIAFLSAVVAVAIGLGVALAAGYLGGRVEMLLMGVVDLTLSFPFFVLVIVLSVFLGRGVLGAVLITGVVLWARPARVLRSQVLKTTQFGHVTAARAMGAGTPRILFRHVMPRLMPLIVGQLVRAANIAVLIQASLAFLGLGDTQRVSWGTTLYFANARSAVLTDAWKWWILPPGLALTVTVVGCAFVGLALEEWADPRLANHRPPYRARRVSRPTSEGRDSAIRADRRSSLIVRGVTVDYLGRGRAARAVDCVDLDVGSGRICGLVGESGSGKTSLANALVGMGRRPAKVIAGSAVLGSFEVPIRRRSEMALLRGRRIAFIPQNAMNALNPARRILDQVAESAALTRGDAGARSRAVELLELVGIPGERHRAYPHELSGGMRQRVVIAMSLANDPELLVADEPTSGLDVVTQSHILALIVELRERLGMTLLLISHDLPMLAKVSDDLAVMYGGRIVEVGQTASIVGSPIHPYTVALLAAHPTLRGPRRVLAALAGEPFDPARLPSGCRFGPRCPHVADRCRSDEPTLRPIAGGRSVACVLVGDSEPESQPVSVKVNAGG